MRKTKKEKIEAEARRERFLYSLSAIQQAPQKEESKVESRQEGKPIQSMIQPQTVVENFSYLKADLRKIVILASIAFLVQIVLYLTIF